jgi:cytochrome c
MIKHLRRFRPQVTNEARVRPPDQPSPDQPDQPQKEAPRQGRQLFVEVTEKMGLTDQIDS